jgi:hypothetical protein
MAQKFHTQLTAGKHYEQELLKILTRQHRRRASGKEYIYRFNTSDENNERKRWDLEWQGKIKYEVKSEIDTCHQIGRQTGNIAIEYEHRGDPSGIAYTTANLWCHFIVGSGCAVVLPVKKLKEIISQNSFYRVKGGDKGLSRMYLVPAWDTVKNEPNTRYIPRRYFKKLNYREYIYDLNEYRKAKTRDKLTYARACGDLCAGGSDISKSSAVSSPAVCLL